MAKDKSLVIKSGNGTFVTDVQELRRRARAHIERGAVTESYRGDVETMLRMLNEALATAIEEGHANDVRTLIEALGKDER